MRKRRLSKHDRNALYIIADGKCRLCHNVLDHNWHADHVFPYSLGGKTEINNMQALCSKCNLRKGNMYLRKHQKELIEKMTSITNEYKKTGILPTNQLVVNVFPGGGKSTHPIIATKILKDAGVIEKILWIVPSKSLKHQGAQEFQKPYFKRLFPHDLEIREVDKTNDVNPTRGHDGFLTTYQALVTAKGNNLNRDNCNEYEISKNKYLIVLDEFHHICPDKQKDPDGYNYYKAVKPLVEKATFVLKLSGTLYRNNNEKIAFLPYEKQIDGQITKYIPQVDISYTIKDALKDQAIIPITYNAWGASMIKYRRGDNRFEKLEIQNNTDLSVAIDTEYGEALLKIGAKHWQDHRLRVNSRSKLIVIGYNQKHCKKISRELKKLGINSLLAISDERDAHNNIKKFRNTDNNQVLITCQMAYEGLDCPEATHLIVLTKIRSLPWLIQMFTRVMRNDKNGIPYLQQIAYAFVPNDPSMLKALKEIHAKEMPLIKDDLSESLEGLLKEIKGSSNEPQLIHPIEDMSSAIGEMSQQDSDGNQLNSELINKINLWQAKWGMYGPTEIDIYNMLKGSGSLWQLDQFESKTTIDEVAEESILTPQEREKKLRSDIETWARKLDYKFREEGGTWNKKIFNKFRKSRKNMSESELKDVLKWSKQEAIKEAEKLLYPKERFNT